MNLSFASAFRIVGLILAVVGGSMLPSFVVSLIYDNSSVYIPFLITMLSSSVAAGVFLLKIFQHDFKTLRVKDGFLVVTLCWFFSAAVGAVPFVCLSQGASQIRSMRFLNPAPDFQRREHRSLLMSRYCQRGSCSGAPLPTGSEAWGSWYSLLH